MEIFSGADVMVSFGEKKEVAHAPCVVADWRERDANAVEVDVYYSSGDAKNGKHVRVQTPISLLGAQKNAAEALDFVTAAECMLEKQPMCAQNERLIAEKLSAIAEREKEFAASVAGLRKIEDALAEQSKALFAEKDALVEKEKAIAESEAELAKIEDALAEQTKVFLAEKDALAKREKAIAASEAGLRKIENALAEKTKALFDDKDAFAQKEKALAERRGELRKIEDALAEQAKALFADQDALAEKEKALAQSEAELHRIEDALAEQTKALFAEQDAFAEKEKAFLAERDAFEEKKKAFAESEAELNAVEEMLTIKVKELYAGEDALEEKQKAFAESETALAEREKALAEALAALEERARLLADKEAALSAVEEEAVEPETEAEPEAEAEEKDPFGNLRSRTFAEKRDALSDIMRSRYEFVDSHIATYDPIRVVEGKKYRTYKSGRHPILKMAIRGKTLSAYLPLDPKEYEYSKYVFTDESESAAFEKYPMRLRLSSDRQARWTRELVDAVAEKIGIAKKATDEEK